MLRLDLRHYETIVAIVDLGTMTAAAQHLAMTQPALSHRLADAERRLGTPLFTRGPQRRLRPTRAGLLVHQTASRALADLERTEDLVVAQEPRTATVRIAVGSYDCYHWTPAFLSYARRREPTVGVEVVLVGDRPGDALAAGKADLVVAPGRPEGPVRLIQLFVDELVLVTAVDHPLAGREWVRAEELEGETYLTYNPLPTPGFEYDRFIRPTAVYPRMVTVVEQTSAITELVAAGVGVSILSRWALTPAIEGERLAAIRCGPHGLDLPWCAVIRADERAESATLRLAELLARYLGSAGPTAI